jgi:sulfoxide reductase heme-binding subunit YedZ
MDMHRFLALLGLGALALHAGTLVLDDAVDIGPGALLVPGIAPYRPLATALGVVAAELMVLIYLSFPLRRRIGARAWRALHWLTYLVFMLATLHGLAAGSDTGRTWALAFYGACFGAVLGALSWRVLVPPTQGGTPHAPDRDRQVAL